MSRAKKKVVKKKAVKTKKTAPKKTKKTAPKKTKKTAPKKKKKTAPKKKKASDVRMSSIRRAASGKRYSEATKQDAQALYEKGMPLSEICRRVRMPNNTKVVRRWLVAEGIQIRSAKTPIYPRAEILKQLKAKRPRSEILEEYGCSTKFMSNLANGKISPTT